MPALSSSQKQTARIPFPSFIQQPHNGMLEVYHSVGIGIKKLKLQSAASQIPPCPAPATRETTVNYQNTLGDKEVG